MGRDAPRSTRLSLLWRIAGAGALVALLATAAWSITVQQADARRLPSPAATAAAVAFVAADLQPGDAVRAAPVWFDSARVGLPAAHHLIARELDPWDRFRFERLWLVAVDGREREIEAARAWAPTLETVFAGDGVAVLRGAVAQTESVAWDAWVDFESARIEQVAPDGTATPCSTARGRERHCGRIDPWIYVAQSTREVDDRYRDCIEVNVAPDARVWRLGWTDLPRDGILRVRAGNTLLATRSDRGAPVHMRVRIDGDVVFESQTPIHDNQYPEWAAPVPEGDAPMNLEFEFEAADHFDRFFCFRAQIIDADAGHPDSREGTK